MRREARVERQLPLAAEHRARHLAQPRAIASSGATRPRGNFSRRGGGIGQQGRRKPGFIRRHRRRRFSEQPERRRADPLRFAPEPGKIEIGLQNLVFRPAALKRFGRTHLAQFVHPVARTRRRKIGGKECGKLHRNRARATRPLSRKARFHGTPDCKPVDPVMIAEALVLRSNHRFDQHRGNVFQRHPGQPPRAEIDPLAVEQNAIAIEKPCLARLPCRDNFIMSGKHWRDCDEPQQQQGHPRERRNPHAPSPEPANPHSRVADDGDAHLIATVIGWFGTCARMSGEYIASTRVGGRLKLPVPLSRTAYSITNRPRGTHSK